MNFTSKIVLALVASTTAGVVAYPMVAAAGPTTGSTAAAVSIKFQKSGTGGFTITPGSTATGGGSGIQELSAAVATGETKASAEAKSTKQGTTATANGYSAPVYLTYETHNDLTKIQAASESTAYSEFKAQAAIDFAAGKKTSQTVSFLEVEKLSLTTKGKKVTALTKEEIEAAKATASSEANVKLAASVQASASQSSTTKESGTAYDSSVGTSYQYSGSSAGLQYLPAVVK
jgi:peroxiredoxin family protein